MRSIALWALGYPNAALADAESAVKTARAIGHAATLMWAFVPYQSVLHFNRTFVTAQANKDELIVFQKGGFLWKSSGTATKAWLLALTGKAAEALQVQAAGAEGLRSTGTTLFCSANIVHFGDTSRPARPIRASVAANCGRDESN